MLETCLRHGEGRALPREAGRAGVDWVVRYHSLYMGLYGWHLFAAVQTSKFVVHRPMAVLYLGLALKGSVVAG